MGAPEMQGHRTRESEWHREARPGLQAPGRHSCLPGRWPFPLLACESAKEGRGQYVLDVRDERPDCLGSPYGQRS